MRKAVEILAALLIACAAVYDTVELSVAESVEETVVYVQACQEFWKPRC